MTDVGHQLLLAGVLATTGPAAGIGGQPLPLEAIVGGVLIVAVPYGLAVLWAARRGKLGTGRHELRIEPGPPSSTTSVHAALSWLADAPERRSVVLSGAGNRHAALDPSGGMVLLGGFDGVSLLDSRDVRAEVMEDRARRLLAADLDRLVGGARAPVVSTFERLVG
jgi:hypothetical protein